MKRLILLRHAKSDWEADFDTDHSRPLNGRGMESARAIGVALARSNQVPDIVISSSALRAQSTAFLAADTGGWQCEIRLTEELYGTSAGSVLSIVKDTPESVDRLMLVGHEPTWSTTAGILIGGGRVRVKTGCAVAIDVASWSLADRQSSVVSRQSSVVSRQSSVVSRQSSVVSRQSSVTERTCS
jgi:phosphohistidine phosphatase